MNIALKHPALHSLHANKYLIWELAKREVRDRYVGSAFGILWAVLHPLALMAVYVFVFGFAFRVRFGEELDLPLDYAAYVICGYLPWMVMIDAMGRSAMCIQSNMAMVKQISFPIEVLVPKSIVGGLVPQAVGTLFLVGYILIQAGALPLTVLLLPVVLVIQCAAALGLGWLLALVGAYFRDIRDFLQVFFLVNMFLMPVVFFPDWLPRFFQIIIQANPFSHLIFIYQDVFFYGSISHPWSWAVAGCLSVFVFHFGYRLFVHAKQAFGNVL